jgi:ribosomal protein S1
MKKAKSIVFSVGKEISLYVLKIRDEQYLQNNHINSTDLYKNRQDRKKMQKAEDNKAGLLCSIIGSQ